MALKPLRPLNADDIFISYTRLDASAYAAALDAELTKLGFSCFRDALDPEPGEDLPDSLKRKIRSCAMLVVVGTERAAGRETIEKEIREFLSTGRTSIVPVNFDDAVYRARWYSLVEGIAPAPELSPNALADGAPSPSVIRHIREQFNYRRRAERLRRITRRAVAVLVLLLIVIAVASFVAWRQLALAKAATAKAAAETTKANEATAKADAETKRAEQAKKDAQDALKKAQDAQEEAKKQKAEADKQTKLAEAAGQRAKHAETRADKEQARAEREQTVAEVRAGANRSQSYLRQHPEDVRGSLSYALDAVRTAQRAGMRNADADTALRESLALLPRRRSGVRLDSSSADVMAISPDGRQYAALDSGRLRVYAVADTDAGARAAPLLERPCDCSAVALGSGLTRAAAVLKGGGFKIFDLQDDSRSRAFDSFKNAPGKKLTTAKLIALSPDGRYLALSADESEKNSLMQHSSLFVIDISEGDPVRTYDYAPGDDSAKDIALGPNGSLHMQINAVAFGPMGDLAVGGRYHGWPQGRLVIWRLNAGAQAGLSADSFNDYEVIPQELTVWAVAPGADRTHFATDKGVWERPLWQSRFEPAARIPPLGNVSYSSTRKIAFRPDGKSLVLARSFPAETQEDGAPEKAMLEVWDASGYRDTAEAFTRGEVLQVGFEPGGGHVAALTEAPSLSPKARASGVTPPQSLRVYDSGAGSEVAAMEPDPRDSLRFYASPGADYVVSLSGESAQVLDVWTKGGVRRKRAAAFGGALESVEAVALSPNGRFLALAGPAGGAHIVVVYRSDGGAYAEVKPFALGDAVRATPGQSSEPMALSDDGRRLAVLYNTDFALHVFDDGYEMPAIQKQLKELGNLRAFALSANGRYLAVEPDLGGTSPVRLLDIAAGSWDPLLDDTRAWTFAFSPDGNYLALVAIDNVVHVFETAAPKGYARGRREEVARLPHTERVTAVAFSDDSRYVVTASKTPSWKFNGYDKYYPLRIWPLRPSDLIAESEKRLKPISVQ